MKIGGFVVVFLMSEVTVILVYFEEIEILYDICQKSWLGIVKERVAYR